MSRAPQTSFRTWLAASFTFLVIGATTKAPAQSFGLRVVTVQSEDSNPVPIRSVFRVANREYFRLGMEEVVPGRYRVEPSSWSRHDRVHVVLSSVNIYHAPDPRPVSAQVEFIVKERISWNATTPVERNLVAEAQSPKKPGDEVLVFTELSRRTRFRDRSVSEAAAQRVWTAAGQILDVEAPMYFDATQGLLVPSDQLRGAITAYQEERDDLDVTSRLDSATMQALADRPHWSFLYRTEAAAGADGPAAPPSLPVDFAEQVGVFDDPVVSILAVNAERARSGDRFGLVALLLNEVASRLRRHGAEDALQLAATAEFETFRAMGMVLAHDEPSRYDPVQAAFVMSSDFTARVRTFQLEVGLAPTGRADSGTLRALAGVNSVGPYLTGVRVPAPQ